MNTKNIIIYFLFCIFSINCSDKNLNVKTKIYSYFPYGNTIERWKPTSNFDTLEYSAVHRHFIIEGKIKHDSDFLDHLIFNFLDTAIQMKIEIQKKTFVAINFYNIDKSLKLKNADTAFSEYFLADLNNRLAYLIFYNGRLYEFTVYDSDTIKSTSSYYLNPLDRLHFYDDTRYPPKHNRALSPYYINDSM